jgi:hypothetical protein
MLTGSMSASHGIDIIIVSLSYAIGRPKHCFSSKERTAPYPALAPQARHIQAVSTCPFQSRVPLTPRRKKPPVHAMVHRGLDSDMGNGYPKKVASQEE